LPMDQHAGQHQARRLLVRKDDQRLERSLRFVERRNDRQDMALLWRTECRRHIRGPRQCDLGWLRNNVQTQRLLHVDVRRGPRERWNQPAELEPHADVRSQLVSGGLMLGYFVPRRFRLYL
ncbi:hypothetical protein LTR16_010401, partial [Cryomyces antarcticus]